MTIPEPVQGDVGARTWIEPRRSGPPASRRSQVAALLVVGGAISMVAMAAPVTTPWVVAIVVALVVGAAIAMVSEPLPPYEALHGLWIAFIVVAVGGVGLGVVSAFAGTLVVPLQVVLVAGGLAAGLDWHRADRLRLTVTVSGIVVLLSALGDPGWIYAVAAAWLAGAFLTYGLLEGDRRAALPRVQPDARDEAQAAPASDLATSVLLALAVALVAALVLSVPRCNFPFDPPKVRPNVDQTGSSSTGQGGSGQGRGSGGSEGAGDHRYVPDPNGRYLVPSEDGEPQTDATGRRIPTPEDAPDIPEGGERVVEEPDGSTSTWERDPNGDVRVTQRGEDGWVRQWRLHEREDGITEIDELRPDGSTKDTYFYDPEGQLIDDGDSSANEQQDQPEQQEDRSKPSWATLLKVLGVLLVVGGLIALAAWWWSKRSPKEPVAAGSAPPWAIELARRMEEEGLARGRARGRGESVVTYGRALADGALPDPRLVVLAEVVSDALFSGTDPGPSVQTWARSTFDEVLAAHPVPSRKEQRERRGKDAQPIGPI